MSTPGVRQGLVLLICCSSLFLVTMDITIVNVALAAIQRDLGASISGLQWSIDGYTLVSASFLMLAGSTADRVGRKKVFQTGLVVFSLGSLLCGLAVSTNALVLCRVLQALGGSMLTPVALSIVTTTFTDPKSRAKSIGLWAAVSGISMAVGPVLGGFLTQNIGWRSIFWINVPIGILALILTARFIPESKAATVRRADLIGQILMVIVLASLISSLIEGPQLGWHSTAILAGTVLFAAAAVGLILYERARAEPLIDLRYFRSVQFSSATLMAVLVFTAFSGFLFLNSLFLQKVRGFSPMQTGLCLLPMAAMMIIGAPIAGKLLSSGHARIAIVTAGFAMALSAAILIALGPGADVRGLLVGYALFGFGFGLINVPITNGAVSSLPNSRAGIAAAFTATSRQIGASLGVAVAGSIAGAQVDSTRFADLPFWEFIVVGGLTVVSLGFISTSSAARRRDVGVAKLLDERPSVQLL